MSLADQLAVKTAATQHLGRRCGFATVLARMDDDLRGEVIEAVNRRDDVAAAVLVNHLSGLGYTVSINDIRRHRQDNDRCKTCRLAGYFA